ncbi:hypothetical protein AB0892_06310 [Streptomyces sp. NPDC005409]|uniref:hypothetical protein n=1 Tax=Streptomyces sp. NPDC005409 TaxID=3155342 RepID=UPI003452FB25
MSVVEGEASWAVAGFSSGRMEYPSGLKAMIRGQSKSMVDSDEGMAAAQRGRFVDALHKWAATVAAAVALAFSLYNFTELQKKPEIDLALPHLMRIGMMGMDTHFYVQPTVSTRVKTQDVELVRGARLNLTPAGASAKRPVFYWKEVGTWNFDPAEEWLSYRWSGDPAPFLVSQEKPQQPIFLFQADGWSFQPGRYEGSLQLDRAGGRGPLSKKFCIIMSSKAADEIRHGASTEGIYFFRNDLPKFSNAKYSGCYVRETD